MAAIQQRASEKGQTVTFTLDDWDVKTAAEMAATCGVAIVFANAGNSG